MGKKKIMVENEGQMLRLLRELEKKMKRVLLVIGVIILKIWFSKLNVWKYE